MGNLTAKTSGEIASFMSPSMTNIKSLKVHFSPKQLGTGDPSPENVREIVGWDGVEVNGSGRNLLQNADGSLSYLYLKKGTTITISQSMDANVGYFRGYDVNKVANTPLVWINQNNNGERRWSEYTLEDDIYYAICYTGTGMKEAQITIDGSVDFKPYQGNNISYQWKLPDEYQEVEWISNDVENNSLVYIDTNYAPTIAPKLITNIKRVKTSDKDIFGFQYNNFPSFIVDSASSRFYNRWGNTSYTTINVTTYNTVEQCEFGKNTIINGELKATFGDIDWSTNIQTMRIFAGRKNNSSNNNFFYIYGDIKLYDGDLLVRHMIPCYRKSDDEIGLYDLITKAFFTKTGTGTFIKGNDVDKTFYGGYVDLINGKLVEDMCYKQITAESLSNAGDYVGYTSSVTALDRQSAVWIRNLFNSTARGRKSGGIKANCNAFKVLMNSTGVSSSQNRTAFAVDSSITNVADFITAVETLEQNGNGLYLAYELATPITHQLTPTQLKSFVGQNNFWSNADYVEVEYDLIETVDIQKAKQKIILNQPQLKTISDKVVSFNTDMVAPMKNCKIYFNPIQLGTGDPSPTNVRDINGWTGVDSYVNGDKFSVDWTNDAGTIYGGYLDLSKNEVVAEWIKYVFNRSSTVSSSGTSSLVEGLTWMTLKKTITSTPPYISTPNSGDSYGFFTIGDWRKAAIGGKNRAFVNSKNLDVVLVSINGEDLTTSEGRNTFFDYIENNEIPIECVYKLATPIHYPLSSLTSQQLLTLKSTNHIWSETNGQQIDVKYWTHKNLTPTPLTNYLENQTWSSNGYISATGKQTPDANSASHYLASPILLEAGTYVLSGFSHYVGSDNTRYRIHAYDSTGTWLRQITFQQIGNLSPVDISFTLDTDTYVNVSIAVDFDGVLAKIN